MIILKEILKLQLFFNQYSFDLSNSSRNNYNVNMLNVVLFGKTTKKLETLSMVSMDGIKQLPGGNMRI